MRFRLFKTAPIDRSSYAKTLQKLTSAFYREGTGVYASYREGTGIYASYREGTVLLVTRNHQQHKQQQLRKQRQQTYMKDQSDLQRG